MYNPHCDLPLLNGFLPFCPPRGVCKLQGVGTNLWFAVVGDLGFQVSLFCSGDSGFNSLLGSFCPSASHLTATLRRCNWMPDMIFANLASLPWDTHAYWTSWTVPHVFLCRAGDTNADVWGFQALSRPPPVPPSGWTARSLTLSHCEAGGATSGWWEDVVWYHPACHAAAPAPFSPRPWFPLQAFVNDRVVACPVPASKAPVDLPPASTMVRLGGFCHLLGSKPGGCVQQWGSFPASDLGATVLLAALGSPSGWGTWALLPLELAALWDVPISVTDLLLESVDLDIVWGFCASAPAKVLFASADALLTTLFWGGGKLLITDVPVPQPDSNKDLGLAALPSSCEGEGGGGGLTSKHRSSREISRSQMGRLFRTTYGSTPFSEAMVRRPAPKAIYWPLHSPPGIYGTFA